MEEITVDYWKGISRGVCYILLATLVYPAQTALIKWGSTMGYIAPVILIFRGIIQLICSLIESTLFADKPHKRKCNIFRIVQDIRTIGIVPRRTRIPLFDDNSYSLLSANNSDNSCSDFPNTEAVIPLTPKSKNIQVVHKTSTPRIERLNTATSTKRKPRSKNFRSLTWTAIISLGAFSGISTYLYFEASFLLPVGDIQALCAVTATITPIFSFIVFRDTLTKIQALSLLGSVCGVILIVHPPIIFHKDEVMDKQTLYGYMYAMGASVLAACCFISIQFARKVPIYILTVSQSIAFIITGTVVLLCSNKLTSSDVLWIDDGSDCAYLLITGFCGYTLLWLIQSATTHLESAIVPLLLNLSIFWGYIVQVAFFHDAPRLLTMSGAVVMFLSAVIVSVDKISDAKQKSISVVKRDAITNVHV